MIQSKVCILVAIKVALFLLFIATLTDGAGPLRSGFGEFCNETTKCQRGAWLSCDLKLEKCVCSKVEEMKFNKEKGKCVALIGDACRFLIPSDDDQSRYQESDCVIGAYCSSTTGLCMCLHGHYEDSELDICLPLKGHGDRCGSASQCAYNKFMTCVGGTCQCENPETMVYDANEDLCRIRAGKACDPSGQQTNRTAPCVATAKCLSNMCTCPSGNYGTRLEGTCSPVKQIQMDCSYDEECNPEERLACVKGKCNCNPLIAVENSEIFTISRGPHYYGHVLTEHTVLPGKCLAKAGQTCKTEVISYRSSDDYKYNYGDEMEKSDPSNIYCVQNAECHTYSNVCVCQDGYQRTSEGMCGKGHSQRCSLSQPCSDNFRCAERERHSPVCVCPNSFHDTYAGDTCFRLIGSPCLPEEGPTKCVTNSECVRSEGRRYLCQCSTGFVMNKERSCDIVFGQDCQFGSKPVCDTKAKLECRSGGLNTSLCSCSNEEDIYEEERRQCSRPLGLACMDDGECISNAACLKSDSDFPGKCACKDGYITSGYSKCFLPPLDVTSSNDGSAEILEKVPKNTENANKTIE